MKLCELRAERFRNLSVLDIVLSARINVIYGDNGSGKSTLLEMVYCLSRGRSFRTHISSPMIQYQESHCTVFAKVCDTRVSTSIAFQKHTNGRTHFKIGHNNKTPTSQELSRLLPVQLFEPDSHDLLSGGPSVRRKFVDWGVFYTEPRFMELWHRFDKALKQRNAALAQRQPIQQVKLWDVELAEVGEALSQCRSQYVQRLIEMADAWIMALVGPLPIQLCYDLGWDNQRSLLACLSTNIDKDIKYGYTISGPHRFDLVLQSNGFSVEKVLSRGEQKRLICAMYLAQGQLFKQVTQQDCVYLLDDILSELDALHQSKVLNALQAMDAQLFVTSLDRERVAPLLAGGECNQFHLVQGRVH